MTVSRSALVSLKHYPGVSMANLRDFNGNRWGSKTGWTLIDWSRNGRQTRQSLLKNQRNVTRYPKSGSWVT